MAAHIYAFKPTGADAETRLLRTRITAVQDQRLLVSDPDCLWATPAFSCLVQPQPGDTVLLALDPDDGTGHVLHILERPGLQDADLNLPGGGTLRSHEGAIQLEAREIRVDGGEGVSLHSGRDLSLDGAQGIRLNSARRVSLDAADISMHAVTAQTTIKHWQGWFDTLEARAVSIEYAAKTLSAKIGRLLSRSLESFRSVKGLDETRAGRSRTTVRDHHEIRAGHVTARAEGFVKIDGKKIDLG